MHRPHRRQLGAHQGAEQFGFCLLAMRHQRVEPGAMAQHADGIDAGARGLLQSTPAEHGQRGLAGDGQHGHAVIVGTGDAGDHIGRARSGSGNTHPQLARFAGIAIGHEGGAGLVAGDHWPQLAASARVACHGVIQWFNRAARYPEHVFDPHLFQVGDDHIGNVGAFARHRRLAFFRFYRWNEFIHGVSQLGFHRVRTSITIIVHRQERGVQSRSRHSRTQLSPVSCMAGGNANGVSRMHA